MAGRETAGAVVVMIDGDASPLLAKYAQAESASRAAGTRIATALGSGFQSSTGLVDQFGRFVQTNAIAPLTQAVPVAQRTAVAIRSVGAAAESTVSPIMAMSGAIRVASGEQSIRAIERFGVSVLGLGAAAQAAFPLIGALAIGELFTRVYERVTKVSEGEKEAANQAKQFTTEIRSLDTEVENLRVRFIAMRDGATAGISAEITAAADQVKEAATQLDNARQALAGGREVTVGGRKYIAPPHPSSVQMSPEAAAVVKAGLEVQKAQEEADLKKQELIKKQEEEQKQAIEKQKQLLQQERTAFKEGYDNQLADLQAAHEVTRSEELRFRERELADAQSRGPGFAPVATEVNRQVGTLSQEIDRANDAVMKSLARISNEEAAKQGRQLAEGLKHGLEEAMPETEAVMTDFFRNLDEQRKESQRQAQEGIRTGGERTQVSDEATKARLQVEYAAQLVHSRAQELSYAQSIAQADQQAILDKIASLEALKQYQESQSLADEANKTDLEIEREKVALLKQQASDEEKIAKLKQQQNLPGLIQQKLNFPGLKDSFNQLGADTVKNSIDGISAAFGRAVQGGENLSKIFRNLGKQLLGEVVAGIAKIGLQMITTAAIGKSVGSTLAVAEVISAAAVGAANAMAATAAIPIIGPALAPGVGAATFAEIASLAGLAAYEKGGLVPEDQIALVHKGEYVLTADQVSAMGAPVSSYGIGTTQLTSTMVHSSDTRSLSIGAIHLHGVRDMQDVARRLPDVLKARSPVFSPATR